MNFQSEAKSLFLNHHPNHYSENDILIMKPIHNGFTNYSFYLQTNDGLEFQIRIGWNNEIVDRKTEYEVLKLIPNSGYIYYDQKNGNAIKTWIQGESWESYGIINEPLLKELVGKIHELQMINPCHSQIALFDYYYYSHNIEIEHKYETLYEKLVAKIATNNWVLSHSDLSLHNILVSNEHLIFIDYEWSRINHPYWDIANFIKESDLTDHQIKYLANVMNVDVQDLIEFVYITITYSYMWTFHTHQSEEIFQYRKFMIRMLKKYYPKVINEL